MPVVRAVFENLPGKRARLLQAQLFTERLSVPINDDFQRFVRDEATKGAAHPRRLLAPIPASPVQSRVVSVDVMAVSRTCIRYA